MPIRIFFCGEVVADMVGNPQDPFAFRLHLGGSQFNGASGASRAVKRDQLDYKIAFVGPLADNWIGDLFTKSMTQAGVDISWLTRVDRNPTMAMVRPIPEQQRSEYFFYKDNTAEEQTTRSELPKLLGEAGDKMICCFGSISTIMEPARFAWLEFAADQKGKALCYYDLNTRPSVAKDPARYRKLVLEWAQTVNVMKASDEDIDWAYPGQSLEQVAKIWLDAGAAMAVFTKGKNGSEIFTAKHHVAVETEQLKNISVTVGAGDNFNAGIAIQLARHDVFDTKAIEALTPAQLTTIITGGNSTAAAHLTALNAPVEPVSAVTPSRFPAAANI